MKHMVEVKTYLSEAILTKKILVDFDLFEIGTF